MQRPLFRRRLYLKVKGGKVNRGIADVNPTDKGSTITKAAPDGELTISRSKQVTIKGWKKPTKEK